MSNCDRNLDYFPPDVSSENLIIKPLEFEISNRKYNIDFNGFRIIQLKGSRLGNFSFYQDYLSFSKIKDNMNCLFINFITSFRLKNLEKEINYDYVIINDADIIISGKYQDIIFNKLLTKNNKTKFILIGNKYFSCILHSSCDRKLEKNENGIITAISL